MYTCAHRLFKKYDCVAIGDYTPHGGGITRKMRRGMNNRSLIGRWKQVLSWVAAKSGKTFFEYKETGSTRTCHHCNYVEPQGIPVALRQWQCPQCETIHHRDENAAINGLRKILRDFSINYEGEIPSIVSCSDLAFIKKRWTWCVLPSGVLVTPQGHGSEVISQLQEIKPRA
jgi:putative transposase